MSYRWVYTLIGVLLTTQPLAATWKIQYADWQQEGKIFHQYPIELLTLALSKTGVNYQLEASDKALSQADSVKQLAAGGAINVIWAASDKYRDQQLLPIKIPIHKGLVGWRQILMSGADNDLLQQRLSMQQLLMMSAVQDALSVDSKVLTANGFKVKTSEQFDELVLMTTENPNAFFPRSIVEVDTEKSKTPKHSLEVHQLSGFNYPLAYYFYVHKKDRLLARVIREGLEKAITSGEYQRLFLQYHSQYIEKIEGSGIDFIPLTNPLLAEDTPLERRELWYSQQN